MLGYCGWARILGCASLMQQPDLSPVPPFTRSSWPGKCDFLFNLFPRWFLILLREQVGLVVEVDSKADGAVSHQLALQPTKAFPVSGLRFPHL